MVLTAAINNSNQSTTSEQIKPAIDPYAYLGIIRNSDGSFTRKQQEVLQINNISSLHHANLSSSVVLTRDIPINQSYNTWFRIYLPRDSHTAEKLPIVVYYHGGGFVMGDVAFHIFDEFCKDMAVEIPAIVVSVQYRLAPDHRLPAAYLDAVEALHCIKNTNEEWFIKYADFNRCYLMGGSAGGNIAYRIPWFLGDDDLGSLKIRGLILQQPFFGGVERTQSEQRLADDKMLPLCANDLMWELGLPVGANRDHEYCNPTVESKLHVGDRIKMLGWKVLVAACEEDPLVDRQKELVRILEKKGIETVSQIDAGGCHGVEFFHPFKGKALLLLVKEFILSSTFP